MISITNAFRITSPCRRNVFNFNSFKQNVPIFNFQPVSGLKTLEEKVGLPPKPKKPLTPYFRYMNQQRSTVRAENPKINIMDVTKLISKKWETVDESIKKKLQEEYKRDQEVYVELRAKYDSKITDKQRDEMKKIKQEINENKEKKAIKKKVRELGRPKKPASAFLKFIIHEQKITARLPNQTYREWHAKCTEKWSRLSDTEKEPFMKESRTELEKYKKEITQWEEKMVRLGHIDVIRHDFLIDPPEPKTKSKKSKSQ